MKYFKMVDVVAATENIANKNNISRIILDTPNNLKIYKNNT